MLHMQQKAFEVHAYVQHVPFFMEHFPHELRKFCDLRRLKNDLFLKPLRYTSSYCQLHVPKGLSNTEVTDEYQRLLQASLIKYPHYQKRVHDLAPQADETIKAYQKRCIISMGTEYYPELMFRMRHLRQTDKQSLFEYHHEVELIIDLLDEPVDSPYHILSFIIGLREVPVRNKVTKQHYERKFPTLEAALQKAQKVSQSVVVDDDVDVTL